MIIGTRGSQLALWQANDLQTKLNNIGLASRLEIIKTKGDKIQDLSFDKIEGKGFFTKEIEEALLAKSIDIAVHSLKDLPTNHPKGLVIAALSEREDCSDLLIINKNAIDTSQVLKLKSGAIVGTSSVRRKSQILDLAPHVKVEDLRGNVPTRVSKLDTEKYDAIILASAGINRLSLDLSKYETIRLNPVEFVPAPAQGVIAYQINEENIALRKKLVKIHQQQVGKATNVERKILNLMEGGCQMPLGVFCKIDSKGYYHVYAAFSKHLDQDLTRVNISRSTSNNLAEDVVSALKK
ncbi:MAG: hydroxymethylbilane synthase [Saprospiraceae bacterium]|nr:hydroxymethylbilane synthase [Bacteroidia bacterium]NNE14091.1 hydroxymethylbilane synthase [Saprospiraceae bacterium]NNL92281.1 hydroxymethylbilane synthase [Saprospiraceae bacterium]